MGERRNPSFWKKILFPRPFSIFFLFLCIVFSLFLFFSAFVPTFILSPFTDNSFNKRYREKEDLFDCTTFPLSRSPLIYKWWPDYFSFFFFSLVSLFIRIHCQWNFLLTLFNTIIDGTKTYYEKERKICVIVCGFCKQRKKERGRKREISTREKERGRKNQLHNLKRKQRRLIILLKERKIFSLPSLFCPLFHLSAEPGAN